MSQNFAVQLLPKSNLAALTIGTAYNYTGYGAINLSVTGLSGGDTISIYGDTFQNASPPKLSVIPLSGSSPGTPIQTITANGVYAVFGGNIWLTVTQTGTASKPAINASLAV